jgi:hypothetical protein
MFIAIEERNNTINELRKIKTISINKLLENDKDSKSVDILPYLIWIMIIIKLKK